MKNAKHWKCKGGKILIGALRTFRARLNAGKTPYPAWRQRIKTVGSILALIAIVFLSGCATSDITSHIAGGGVTYNPDGTIGANISLKDAQRLSRKQCEVCATVAKNAENSTYKAAVQDMSATHKNNLVVIRAQYRACSVNPYNPNIPAEIVPIPQGPQSGDVIIDAPINPGSLPESGVMKGKK